MRLEGTGSISNSRVISARQLCPTRAPLPSSTSMATSRSTLRSFTPCSPRSFARSTPPRRSSSGLTWQICASPLSLLYIHVSLLQLPYAHTRSSKMWSHLVPCGSDGNGTMSINEWFRWALRNASQQHGERALALAFQKYDADKTGFCTWLAGSPGPLCAGPLCAGHLCAGALRAGPLCAP